MRLEIFSFFLEQHGRRSLLFFVKHIVDDILPVVRIEKIIDYRRNRIDRI